MHTSAIDSRGNKKGTSHVLLLLLLLLPPYIQLDYLAINDMIRK
jgi:hypothetical protein